jgi:hypothetical protein
VHGRNFIEVREPGAGAPQHADTHRDQQRPEKQRRDGLVAAVSVVVVGIGLCAAMAVRDQHNEIGDEIGKRVNAVGDQRLGMREQAHGNLQDHEDRVEGDANQRTFAGDVLLFRDLDGCGVGHDAMGSVRPVYFDVWRHCTGVIVKFR